PDVHELLGGDAELLAEALWRERAAYDRGAVSAAEYWGTVAAAVGVDQLTEHEIAELQGADDRYFLRLDPRSRALIHDLARNRVRLALLANASQAFGEAVRRADWFEAFTVAVISGEERAVTPDRETYQVLLDALPHETARVTNPSPSLVSDGRRQGARHRRPPVAAQRRRRPRGHRARCRDGPSSPRRARRGARVTIPTAAARTTERLRGSHPACSGPRTAGTRTVAGRVGHRDP